MRPGVPSSPADSQAAPFACCCVLLLLLLSPREQAAQKAMSKNMQTMGSRYIELFEIGRSGNGGVKVSR